MSPGRARTGKRVAAVAVVLLLAVLPMASALPAGEDQEPLGGDGTEPLALPGTERVPVDQRPWLLRAHEGGEPYPPELSATLGAMGHDETVRVIVQFRDGTSEGDVDRARAMGLEPLHQWVGVDAWHMRGPVGAVWDLVDSGLAWYVEGEVPIVHDMEVGTRVINATRVWASQVQQRLATSGERVTGAGVTCVVVDTGIDASHPDLDYGQKVLFNLRSDTGDGPYYEIENSDLGYGHGTHVAGTVAGNGDASAGARRGVAPGANLIGITVDTDNSAGYIGALDWVWQNSRPGNNPHNIRLLTNSWHTTVEEYDPQSALIVLINAITYENNVVSTWSAGNDGRQDPEGEELTTSGQGNTPVAIMCAAYERDGSGIAEFSSRGRRGDSHTYPDVGAPGVSIWSCSARRTVISAGSYVGGNTNPYYLAISGTSMSTPHVAGLVALLWQAAPSLRLSYKHEDHSGDPGDWFDREDTRIHEVEWIVEATATYLEGRGLDSNGIPRRDEALDGRGVDGEPIDFVQGYGLVNAERAVGVALALEQLRMDNPGANVSVADAMAAYDSARDLGDREVATDTLAAGWDGEYSRYNDQQGNPLGTDQNQTKLLWVPEGTESVDIEMKYATIDLVGMTLATLTYTVDFGHDGSVDVTGDMAPSTDGVRRGTVSASGHGDQWWGVSVYGQGFRLNRPLQDRNYVEVRVEYSTTVVARLGAGSGALLVEPPSLEGYYWAMSAPWSFGPPSPGFVEGTAVLPHLGYDLTEVRLLAGPGEEGPPGEAAGGGLGWWLLLLLVLLVAMAVVYGRTARGRRGRLAFMGELPGRAFRLVTRRTP